jgi:hypothetical protein
MLRFTARLAYLSMVALALAASPASAANEPASPAPIILEGELTGADHETYLELPFEVPPGTERLTVTLAYDRENRTVIDLGLRDPNGFRGWSGGSRQSFTVSASDASPSYTPGPIVPGTWRLILGVPNIRQTSSSAYRAEIMLTPVGAPLAESAFFDGPIREEAAWYRGDFHTHTGHSDGSCESLAGRRVPCPVFRTLEGARRAGLDFVAVTEHNSVSHHAALRELQPYYDTILLIPGREITTFGGHVNVFGPLGDLEFQLGGARLPTIDPLLSKVAGLGGFASINHPGMPSGEACMGCGWIVEGMDFGNLAAVEVVNGGTMLVTRSPEGPLSHIPFWQRLLDRGHRVAAIAGSDNHDPDNPGRQSPVGRPTTVVYAQNLSQRALFDGVRAGRVFVDMEAIPGRHVDLVAKSHDAEVRMGGVLSLAEGETATLTIETRGVEGAKIELVRGASAPALRLNAQEQLAEGGLTQQTVTLEGAARPYWVRTNIRNADGAIVLISNPIYVRNR